MKAVKIAHITEKTKQGVIVVVDMILVHGSKRINHLVVG